MSKTYNLSSEHNLEEHFAQQIEPFWRKFATMDSFQSDDDVRIAYVYCLCPDAIGTVVLSPGRTEGYLKYQELMFDLFNQGYSVFAIDHRGQGLSGRLIDHPQKGYVDDFQHYVDDFHYFYHHIVTPNAEGPLCLLGHSMGATIATLYIQQNPDDFVAAAMSAPMYGFDPGKLPISIAKALSRVIIGLKALQRRSTDYFIGQFDYCRVPFEENNLTHCKPRFVRFREQYEQEPALRLGGITYHWLSTALRALDRMFAHITVIKTPMLIIQSLDEGIVSLPAQSQFHQLMQTVGVCELVAVEGARHEVLFETDARRTQALAAILDFFDQRIKD